MSYDPPSDHGYDAPDGPGSQLEQSVAHLTRVVEDLSDVVARQDKEIAVLTHRVQLLLEREAHREADGSGGIVLGDERPPHY